MIQKTINPDFIGAAASGLCLIHCVATPFLFIAKACTATSACCAGAPVWWQAVDYIFIVVSFMAILYATKNTTETWIKTGMWACWALLLATILSETFEFSLFPSSFSYVPALGIIGLHIYNAKYCSCTKEECCNSILIDQ